LAVIFVLVPVFLYMEFRSADRDSQELLLRSVRDEGRVISQSLLPLLEAGAGAALPELSRHPARFAGEVTTIKVLLAPNGAGAGTDGPYYVASWPAVAPGNLEAERETLARQGVLDRLAQNCWGELPFSLIYDRPTGGAEIVTAVTPLSTAAEFDRMVDALHRSAADIRRSAEDNAHAFKTPIAIIRQSLEPLRRVLPADNQRVQRAIGVVEHSLDRLDGLVASARSLDEAVA